MIYGNMLNEGRDLFSAIIAHSGLHIIDYHFKISLDGIRSVQQEVKGRRRQPSLTKDTNLNLNKGLYIF